MSERAKRDKEMREQLGRVPPQNEGSWVKREVASVPEVGVFFVHGDNLLVDTTPVDEGILYADMRTHDRSHETFGRQLQSPGAAVPHYVRVTASFTAGLVKIDFPFPRQVRRVDV